MASFSTAFTPDQCWDSEKRPGEVCVTISVNLTKDFGLAKRVGWGGWCCGGPGQGGGDTQTRPLRPPPFLLNGRFGEVGHCVLPVLCYLPLAFPSLRNSTRPACAIRFVNLSELLTGTFAWIAF